MTETENRLSGEAAAFTGQKVKDRCDRDTKELSPFADNLESRWFARRGRYRYETGRV